MTNNGNKKQISVIYKSRNEGFIALFSVIVITAILLLMATTLSFSGFFGRLNVFNSELKKESDALASACIDYAMLKLATEIDYTGNEEVDVGSETCNYEISTGGKINTWASSGKAYTYYEALIDTEDFEIISFKELANEP
jgi:hypothetical protein